MELYKFTTTISENGTIQVTNDPALFNKEVEITIAPKQTPATKQNKAVDFVKKWAGALTEDKLSDTKYQYLLEKYK